MKTIRNMSVLLGLALLVVGLTATKVSAQSLTTTSFTGTFTLPFDVQWGRMNLPAGEYNLYYGHLNGRTPYMVEIAGEADGSPHSLVLTRSQDPISTSENVLVCIREGNNGYVREMKLGAIGQSATFPVPHGVEVRARIVAENLKGHAPLAQPSTLVEVIPIRLVGK